MRILAGIAVLALLGSLWPAWSHWKDRPPDLGTERFVIADPDARAAWGEKEKCLGAALSGYGEAVERRPDDLEALKNRIRTVFRLSGTVLSQAGMDQLMRSQLDAYLARRGEIDPDGAFLQELLQTWIGLRLAYPTESLQGFYAHTAASMYLAARGDERGVEGLWRLTRMGDLYVEFLPYVRMVHPSWRAVEPLVEHYLRQGDLAARVEAGLTLLDYHSLFGVGKPILDRALPDIRAAFKEGVAAIYRGQGNRQQDITGERAIFGVALLALHGFEEERALLDRVSSRTSLARADYPNHIEAMRIARIWGGIVPMADIPATGQFFLTLGPSAQELYYAGAWHRAARYQKSGVGDREKLQEALDVLENGFHSGAMKIRVLSLHALSTLDVDTTPEVLRRALSERSVASVAATILDPSVQDPVPHVLPALMSMELDTPALAAVTLLDLPAGPALQR